MTQSSLSTLSAQRREEKRREEKRREEKCTGRSACATAAVKFG
jgi:hypothetical protein